MKTKLLLLCAGIFFAHNAWAQMNLDIEGAVQMALEKNLSLERSRMERDAAKRTYSRSWNSLIPSLSAGALAARPSSITGEIPSAADVWTPGFSLAASMQISPSVAAHIAQTKAEYAAGRVNYEAARQETEFQVRHLYCQILLLKANVELARQNAATAQSRYAQIAAQRRAGMASNLDELSARLDAQTQKTNVLSARAAYDNALDSLKTILLIPSAETLVLHGGLENFAVNEQAPGAGGGESLRMSAQRQVIAALQAQRNSARMNAYAPSLNFSWNASPLYNDTTEKWADNGGQFSISLSLKLDNYLPWSQAKEQIDSLSDAIAQQQNALAEAALNQQTALQKLARNIAQSEEAVETLRLNAAFAEESYKMHEEAYQKGAADLQSLYTARDSVSLAYNKLLSEQYNLIANVLELEKELNLDFGSIGRFE